MDKETIEAGEKMRETFCRAINYAIDCDNPRLFLDLWRSGQWDQIKQTYPDYELPEIF